MVQRHGTIITLHKYPAGQGALANGNDKPGFWHLFIHPFDPGDALPVHRTRDHKNIRMLDAPRKQHAKTFDIVPGRQAIEDLDITVVATSRGQMKDPEGF
jgi:hypothetical protein